MLSKLGQEAAAVATNPTVTQTAAKVGKGVLGGLMILAGIRTGVDIGRTSYRATVDYFDGRKNKKSNNDGGGKKK